MKAYSRRDLSIVTGFGSQADTLVIACDSCGGIGEKTHDKLKISPYYVGKLTARVGLTEVMCSGATPITIANGVACEMQPTGEEIISGIKDELKNANLHNVILTGSTEENIETSMTAVGMTVIGVANQNALKFNKAQNGDKVILFGVPKVGSEVDLKDKGFYKIIKHLLNLSSVREIIPVGSKGVYHEAKSIAELNGLIFVPYNTLINIEKTAGPVTCIIAICSDYAVTELCSEFTLSNVVGELSCSQLTAEYIVKKI